MKSEQKDYVGDWTYCSIKNKGYRKPKTRFSEGIRVRKTNMPVELIAEKCVYEGRTEYLIKRVRSDDLTWHCADTLDCHEMMEEYKLEAQFAEQPENEDEGGEE